MPLGGGEGGATYVEWSAGGPQSRAARGMPKGVGQPFAYGDGGKRPSVSKNDRSEACEAASRIALVAALFFASCSRERAIASADAFPPID